VRVSPQSRRAFDAEKLADAAGRLDGLLPLPLGARQPLTQLRVGLGSASPTLRNPPPHWAHWGRGKGEGTPRGGASAACRAAECDWVFE
jgi:hypothetical protein